MTTVELNAADAILFMEFRRLQDSIAKIIHSGALEVRGGSVTLHYDADGTLRRIDRSDSLLRS